MHQILAVAAAGALGSVSRYALSAWALRTWGEGFAWGTLTVNVLGCLGLAFLLQLGVTSELVPPSWRVPLAVGFFGAFTTFSTFGYETWRLAEEGAFGLAALNILANLTLCLLAIGAGLAAAKLVTGPA